MSHNADILNHMEKYGSITPLEALNLYGCFRLSGRIYDLRKQGIPIRTETVTGKREDGSTYTFARYSIVKEEKNNV